jgi:hypothetical protein
VLPRYNSEASGLELRNQPAGRAKLFLRMSTAGSSIYYGAEKKQIRGMLTVRTEDERTWWCKYHNIATVTRE